MAEANHLILLEGKHNDERIRVADRSGAVLFRGYSDHFVTSAHGELELNLNFGDSDAGAFFALRRVAEYALLLPRKADRSGSLTKFDKIVAIEWTLITQVWAALRYDPSELSDVPSPSGQEWSDSWLRGSPLRREGKSDEAYGNAVINAIVAENPDGNPTTKQVIAQLISGQRFVKAALTKRTAVTPLVTAFVDTRAGIQEWTALGGTDRNYLTITDVWLAETSL